MKNITIKDIATSIAAIESRTPGTNSAGVKEDLVPVAKLPVNRAGDPDADTEDVTTRVLAKVKSANFNI